MMSSTPHHQGSSLARMMITPSSSDPMSTEPAAQCVRSQKIFEIRDHADQCDHRDDRIARDRYHRSRSSHRPITAVAYVQGVNAEHRKDHPDVGQHDDAPIQVFTGGIDEARTKNVVNRWRLTKADIRDMGRSPSAVGEGQRTAGLVSHLGPGPSVPTLGAPAPLLRHRCVPRRSPCGSAPNHPGRGLVADQGRAFRC